MENKTINYTKAGIDFKLEFQGGRLFKVIANGMWKTGDSEYNEKDTKIESLNGGFKDGKVQFIGGYILVNNSKMGGLKIDDAGIGDQMLELMKTDAEQWDTDKKDRENNRTVGYPDYDNIVIYSIGCDTGLIYSEEKRPVIELALKSGVKPTPLLRGERDTTNKFKGQMDAHIPVEYAKMVNGKLHVEGYIYVYEDLYFISKKDFDNAKAIIDNVKFEKKQEADQFIQQAFATAKETGLPVLLSKVVVAEEDSPLANDGEGDMVDICTMAMPDGTTDIQCFHNY